MNRVVPDKTAVAFYNNRNRLRIERELSFSPELPELPKWVEPEAIIDPDKMEAYAGLCKLAIATTTRILFLPPEKNFMRALMTGLANPSYKPTGGHCVVEGPNFTAGFSMGSVDFAHDGLGCSRPEEGSYLSFGHTASVDGYLFLKSGAEDDQYYRLDIGQSACLIHSREYPMRVAGPEVVSEWISDVLTPLEEEIKARAYEWLGDGKTDPLGFDRIV